MDVNTILIGILVSALGMGLFIYGKSMTRWPHLAIGIALMLISFLVYSVLGLLLLTASLLALLWLLRDR